MIRLRTIKRFIRNILLVAALFTALFKGREYIPYLSKVSISDVFTSVSDTPSNKPASPAVRYHDTEVLTPLFPKDGLGRPEQMLFRKSYAVSYNKDTKCPNWVFWQLTREHADGSVQRPDYAFHEDPDVPAPRATLDDYRHSGLDRGHMCPAGDNKWDDAAMYETFLLTNMCPQNQQLNSGLWNQIEMQCRYWAKKYGSLYICCGPIYLRGEHRTIGHNRVMVPDAFFKVIACLEGQPRGTAYICRNAEGSRKKDLYVNTIADVERITGYMFFPNLSVEQAEAVKSSSGL